MSERIEVGDFVQVVRPPLCCGIGKAIGYVFKVEGILLADPGTCNYCGSPHVNDIAVGYEAKCSLYTLKRIPPLAELESQQERETCPVEAS